KRLGLRCVSSFCQAEGGIRYCHVIGVQTCALPISCARDHVGGPYLLTEPHREPADLTGPEPVRDEGPQQSGGQHALSEHRRITGRAGQFVVVVHRVEVAGRTGVADEHLAGQRTELARSRLDSHPQCRRRSHRAALSMNVAFASATNVPSWARYSVTTVANRIIPPRLPGLEYRSTM